MLDDEGAPPPTDESVSQILSTSPDRALNRWGDAANGFHSKFDGFVGTQLVEQANRTLVQGGWMSAGNFFYKGASMMTEFAVQLNVIDGMGSMLDGIVKVLLEALIGVTGVAGGGILFASIVIIVLVVSIIRNARGGTARILREIGAIAIVVAVVFGLGSAALAHVPGSGKYDPAPGTPGWAVKSVNEGINWLAATPASYFTDNVEEQIWGTELGEMGGEIGCAAYMSELSDRFEIKTINATTTSGASMVAVARVMDSLWTSTGLYTWAKTQGGYNNEYGDKVLCRILDFRSGSNPGYMATLTYGEFPFKESYNSNVKQAVSTDAVRRAPFAPSTPENTTASIVAWAACKPVTSDGNLRWEWEKGWENYYGGIEDAINQRGERMGDKTANTECNAWWNAKRVMSEDGKTVVSEQEIPNIFHIKGDLGWIGDRSREADEGVYDFLVNLTGLNVGGTTAVHAYGVGAFLTMIAFAVIALVVIVAKLFAAMFILLLWFVLIGALFQPSAMKERLLKTANKFLGTAVFAAMTTLILTFVVVFTRALIRVGIDVWGAGHVGSMIWSGLAPVTALILVHLMFTKVFKLPSPVSLRGAQAWSKAGLSGSMGNAVGSGVGSYFGSRLGSLAKGAGRQLGNSVMNKVTGGRGAGIGGAAARSAMTPAAKGNKAPTVSDELAQRVENEEMLTKKEKKTWDKHQATVDKAEAKKNAPREKTLAKEAAAEQRKADRADLREARKAHMDEFQTAAPGDLRGAAVLAASQGASKVAAVVGGKAKQWGSSIAGKTGITSLRSELADRQAQRRAALDARRASVEERRALRGKVTVDGAAKVDEVAEKVAPVMDGAEGQRKREVWGAPDLTGGLNAALGGGAALAGTAAAAAAVVAASKAPSASTVAFGAADGAAKLLDITGPSYDLPVSAPVHAERTMIDSSPKPQQEQQVQPQAEQQELPAVAVGTHTREEIEVPVGVPVAVPVVATPVITPPAITPAPIAVMPAPITIAPASISNPGPIRSIEVPMSAARVQPATRAQARTGLGAAPIARSTQMTPEQAKTIATQGKTAVQRAADVISAPASAALAARQRVWQAKDSGAEKVHQVVNSRAVQAARNDAKVAGALVGAQMEQFKQTGEYRAAEKVAKAAATVTKKSASLAVKGGASVVRKRANDAALLEAFRAQRSAAQALRGEQSGADAVRVVGTGDAPGITTNGGLKA